MFTLNKILENITDENQGNFVGPHYDNNEIIVFVMHGWTPWLQEGNTFNRVYELCEQAGIDFRFDDEIISDEHGRAHEQNPGYNGQVKTWIIINECEVMAEDEVNDNLEEYTEWLTNNSNTADLWGIDFSSLGYEKHSGQYESGFHPGQNDNPETIQAELLKTYDSVIWSIDNTGQFDIGFSAWVKKESENE